MLVALVLVIVIGAVLRVIVVVVMFDVVVAAVVVAVAAGVVAILAVASSHPVQPRIFASASKVLFLGCRGERLGTPYAQSHGTRQAKASAYKVRILGYDGLSGVDL